MWSIGISRQESRRGAEVAKSWHESNRLILDQRDKAIESLKESIETQAELSKQNEELTIRVQTLENERIVSRGVQPARKEGAVLHTIYMDLASSGLIKDLSPLV